MKKYLTVGYAYPVYFLLILGQYFLAEGLYSLNNAPAGAPVVVQPVRDQAGATAAAPGGEKKEGSVLAKAGSADGKGR